MTPDGGDVLLPIARAAIARALGVPATAAEDARWLSAPGASFVTLKQRGELRGCLGSLEARRSLLLDIKANAVAAAFRDPRFVPVSQAELPEIRIEVSVLSPLAPIEAYREEDALARLRPHEDGVVLEYGSQRGTFLPQVWESLPKPADFLRQLKRKAGLPESFWSAEIRLSRYTVLKWREGDVLTARH